MAEKLYQFKFIPKKCSYNSPSYKIYTVKFIDGDEEIIPNLYMGKYKVYSVAGDIPDLAIGQEYNSTVRRKHSQKYGFSYEPVTLEFSNATTPEEISKAFLNSIISPEKAETLMENYPNIVDKIMNDDTKDIDFTKLKGIGEKSFKKIASKVKERYDMINIMAYFKGAISMSVVNKLQSEYNTLHSIKRNLEDDPYKALCKLPGIGFKKADEIVQKLEKEEILTNLYPVISSKERLYACLEYALLQNESNGHTLMSVLDLRALCMKETPEAIEHFTECLNNPRKSLYINKDLKLIGLSRTHNKELYILDTIRELNKKPILWKGDKEKYRNIYGYPLSDEQLEPIDMMCNNNIGILTGYAGTGKTSCLKALIEMCDNMEKRYVLCSPTGKAAKVLANATNRNASTIHIALGYKVDDKGIGYFEYNKNNKLETDLVVVDEVSMLGVHLANALFEAIDTKNTKLLLIGDEGQLRSIEPMDLLHDILDKNLAPSCRLTKVYRYNDGGLSKICTDVRNGQPYMEDCPKKICTVEGVNKDFVQYAVEDSKIPNRVEYIFENLLKSGVQVDDIVILTSQNKGDYGTVAINNRIQSLYQKDYKGASYKIGNIAYLKGDKVIHCRNNYNMELSPLDERYDEEEDVTVAIMNGTTGIVVDVDNEYVDVEYPDGIVRYTKDTIQDLNLGYCITIHKSQGSTFKEVIVLLPKAHVYQFSRQLIYTAYSRTSKRCFSVGNVRYVNMGIKKKSALNRNTWYKYI